IKYLMRHWHSTPFEMCEIKYHVKLPIFIARQWIRHRTANVNEYSARYSMLDREFYIPAPEHLAAQSEVNNQGRGDVLRDEEANEVLEMLKADAVRSYDRYETLLNERQDGRIINDDKQGLARELARMTLPLSAYTQWYWKVDLHNLVHFLSLRMDPHAQYEIRAFADVMYDLVRDWVPLTAKAFEDYRLNSFSLSGPMVAAVRRMVSGEKVTVENCGMSAREWRELQAALGLSD
ncbi:MAG: FAD-dependent thymidylate synthase, partial [Alphaproteobacteria bacterium]